MGLFDGKVVVITGAGAGIGRAHALAFAKEGAKVVVNDLGGDRAGGGKGSEAADAVVAEIKAAGGEAVANYDTVATREGADGILWSALSKFGRADVLVNNAGVLRDRSFLNLSDADWDLVQAVHLKGTYYCCQTFARHLKVQGEGGRIINTTSLSGLLGNFGQGNYSAAKAGIYGLTRTLAIELAKLRVTVNAIAPVALTRMTEDLPMLQGVTAEQLGPQFISPAVLFLASDLASEITGTGARGPGRPGLRLPDGAERGRREGPGLRVVDPGGAEEELGQDLGLTRPSVRVRTDRAVTTDPPSPLAGRSDVARDRAGRGLAVSSGPMLPVSPTSGATAATKKANIRLPYESVAAFLKGFSRNVTRGGVFLPMKQPWAPGLEVRFALILKSGQIVLEGDGTVLWARSPGDGQPGVGLMFGELTASSLRIIDAVVASRGPEAEALEPPRGLEGAAEESEAPVARPPRLVFCRPSRSRPSRRGRARRSASSPSTRSRSDRRRPRPSPSTALRRRTLARRANPSPCGAGRSRRSPPRGRPSPPTSPRRSRPLSKPSGCSSRHLHLPTSSRLRLPPPDVRFKAARSVESLASLCPAAVLRRSRPATRRRSAPWSPSPRDRSLLLRASRPAPRSRPLPVASRTSPLPSARSSVGSRRHLPRRNLPSAARAAATL